MANEYQTKRRIEFADTDMAGIVHFSRFFVWMEQTEHEFLRSLGASVTLRIGDQELGFPRVSASCEFIAPARFEEILDIDLRVARKGSRSMTYEFLFHVGDRRVAKGHLSSVCCVVDCDQVVATKIPSFLADQLQEAPATLD